MLLQILCAHLDCQKWPARAWRLSRAAKTAGGLSGQLRLAGQLWLAGQRLSKIDIKTSQRRGFGRAGKSFPQILGVAPR